MNRPVSVALTFLIVASLTHPAAAFDGRRNGFTLGFGVGAGALMNRNFIDGEGTRVNQDWQLLGGPATDLLIGWGFGERWMILHTEPGVWYTDDARTLLSGTSTISVMHYFDPEPGGWYVVGGLAAYGVFALGDGDTDSWTGPGFVVGFGREFTAHWAVGVEIGGGRASDTIEGVDFGADGYQLTFTVKGLAY